MTKFIELHEYSNSKPLLINLDKIVSAYTWDECTVIATDDSKYLISEDYVTVKRIIENELRKG